MSVAPSPTSSEAQCDAHVHDAFRVVGFTREALNHRHGPAGFAWLCAFNGVPPERAPWQWAFASSATMRAYIERRATQASPETARPSK